MATGEGQYHPANHEKILKAQHEGYQKDAEEANKRLELLKKEANELLNESKEEAKKVVKNPEEPLLYKKSKKD